MFDWQTHSRSSSYWNQFYQRCHYRSDLPHISSSMSSLFWTSHSKLYSLPRFVHISRTSSLTYSSLYYYQLYHISSHASQSTRISHSHRCSLRSCSTKGVASYMSVTLIPPSLAAQAKSPQSNCTSEESTHGLYCREFYRLLLSSAVSPCDIVGWCICHLMIEQERRPYEDICYWQCSSLSSHRGYQDRLSFDISKWARKWRRSLWYQWR